MKRRSGEAQAAQHRKAGPMEHRLKPRGGAKNEQLALLAEAELDAWQTGMNWALDQLEDAADEIPGSEDWDWDYIQALRALAKQ